MNMKVVSLTAIVVAASRRLHWRIIPLHVDAQQTSPWKHGEGIRMGSIRTLGFASSSKTRTRQPAVWVLELSSPTGWSPWVCAPIPCDRGDAVSVTFSSH